MIFVFHQLLQPCSYLIQGCLVAINTEYKFVLATFTASSGFPGYQTFGSLTHVDCGAIPPNEQLSSYRKNAKLYTLETVKIPFERVPGTFVNFYNITPNVVEISGVERSNFGIHFHSNIRETSGYIRLKEAADWDRFETLMKNLRGEGLYSVPLVVSYSRQMEFSYED
jgi:hypothetical protein